MDSRGLTEAFSYKATQRLQLYADSLQRVVYDAEYEPQIR